MDSDRHVGLAKALADLNIPRGGFSPWKIYLEDIAADIEKVQNDDASFLPWEVY